MPSDAWASGEQRRQTPRQPGDPRRGVPDGGVVDVPATQVRDRDHGAGVTDRATQLGEASPLLVTDLQIGQLVEVDEGSGRFVLVEDVREEGDLDGGLEPDPAGGLVEIDYLDPTTDEAGQVAVDASTVLWART